MFILTVDQEIQLSLCNHIQAPQVYALVDKHRAYLSQWLSWPEKTTQLEDYLHFVTTSLHRYADMKGMVCFILYQGELVGSAAFNSIDLFLQKAEIGYWLAEQQQGKGIMTRTCRYLINFAFAQLGLEKIEIRVAEENHQSRAVCQRLGLRKEGIITHAECLHGRFIAHVCYGLECRHWPQGSNHNPEE
ncbi:MAG: GNAT family protein [Candidatus Electrothrix sp. GW3-4]|uniref:GNAT family N-acetyltransferase n=1 Tax=Candidatus Electrothrix sp. GW3-4 TaxID=3126740 RepID=UPI0030CD2458